MKITNVMQYLSPKYIAQKGYVLSLTLMLLLTSITGQAQETKLFNLGKERDFSEKLLSVAKTTLLLQVSEQEQLEATIQLQEGNMGDYKLVGNIGDKKTSTFDIVKKDGFIIGKIILRDAQRAFQYYSGDDGNVYVEEIDINKLVCISYATVENKTANNVAASSRVPELESQPGAPGIVYLDFDGELVENTNWVGGGTIDAAPSGYSDEEIMLAWRIMAEDFRSFNLNITTRRELFDAAPVNRRMMVIFTPTKDAAPTAGGVAYLYSFSSGLDEPCWVYNRSGRSAGETGSHELGHTLGLSHDGINRANGEYYSGHGEWSPIMGWSANTKVGHWSLGEYTDATQQEDDIAIISGASNGVGFKDDDHGGTPATASLLVTASDGTVNADQNTGLIAERTDVDVFSFVTSGGEVRFDVNPDTQYRGYDIANLNIQARILDGRGEELAISNPYRNLSASIITTLPEGTYFLEIDGAGEDDVNTGYSDYSSIGLFSISGSYPLGDNNQPPVANFDSESNCNEIQFRSTSINTVDSYLWDFGDGNTSTAENPTHSYAADGMYTVTLTVTNARGTDSYTLEVEMETAQQPVEQTIDVCRGTSNAIELNGDNAYLWYDQETNGRIIGSGTVFNTPELDQNTTYYVSGILGEVTSHNVGITSINDNRGGIHGGGFALTFNAENRVILKKATVFARGTRERTLVLRDENGNAIASKVIMIEDGEQVIDIDFEIPVGNNMEIGFNTGSDLFRNNRNVSFPYSVDGLISITGTTNQNSPTGFYYYLYNWEIETLGRCETVRVPVHLNVTDAPETPTIVYNESTDELTIQGATTYDRYQWYINGEPLDGATSAIYIADRIGEYTVGVYNQVPCEMISNGVRVSTLDVTEFEEDKTQFVMYPNPAKDIVYLKGNQQNQIEEIKIVDVLGKTVMKFKDDQIKEEYNIESLNEGMYFLVIDNKISKKLIKK